MHASVWPAITPRPRTVSERSGAFTIPAELPVSVAAEIGDAGAWIARVGAAFERILDGRTRLAPVPGSGSGAAASPTLRVTLDPAQRDAYRLRVAPDGIDLTAADRDGASQGLATLCQAILLSDDDRLPAAELADSPATEWRGFMLDVARHFFPMESLDRVVDYLWLMRLNRFQIHLTDDQGWRVPVPDYPRLVEIGAWRPAGTSDNQVIGGAYSSDELRRLDGECRLLGITAVPEVDLPGHASALLSAYPELSCAGGEWAVETRWGIFPAVICASSRSVQTMLERVYGAVADLFAGPYIHVGGDEVPPEPWHACEQCSTLDDPYQTIVRRMTESVLALGRRPIAWDEASGLSLPEQTIIVNWRGPEGAANALKRGYDLVLAPEGKAAYLDHKHLDSALEPGRIGVCTVEDSTRFAPVTYVAAHAPVSDAAGTILGGQANLWTEGIPHHRQVEYMAYLRLAAVADGLWTGRPGAGDDGITARLNRLRAALLRTGHNVYPGGFR